MMKAVLHTIRILVIILLIEHARCQDAFSDQDLRRLQQIANNDGQMETITSYSTNIIQRDPNSQSVSAVNGQYHMTDDKNEDYNRADRSRSRKVYRIKNPFQRPEESEQQDIISESQDSGVGASNQYASMQYSLPPEEFLRQMRAESQFYQSTPAPGLGGYTATPQPSYQYSTAAPSAYDNQASNQVQQLDPKVAQAQAYQSNQNYQYGGQNSYGIESAQSTSPPAQSYLSTSNSNNQFVDTPSNSYVSSSSPIYLSSPQSLQQYVSSPLSVMQAGSPDYTNNKITSTMGSNSYDNSELNKKMQIDHYDNAANGMRYPQQQQYQNDYPSSTIAPSSSMYPGPVHDSWQNSVSKSLQEVQLSQYQYPYNQQQQQQQQSTRSDQHPESDTHRIGNMPSANNVYMNYVQPDYQLLSNLRSRTRDLDHETAQPDVYSHGEYGWKMNNRRPALSQDSYVSENYPAQRYQTIQPDDAAAISQMSFHMDTSRPYSINQVSKSAAENLEAQEFAKAAAKAHEKVKQQQQQPYYGHNYPSAYNNNNQLQSPYSGSPLYSTEKQKSKLYGDSSNPNNYYFGNLQQDLVTASPYFYSRENLDFKSKLPFDHAKALKNIVPIDVSNVVSNSESQLKSLDNNRLISNYNKDLADHGVKQYLKPLTDSFYKDKNAIYGFNIKKPDGLPTAEGFKQAETSHPYYGPKNAQESSYYGQSSYDSDNKRYGDSGSPPINYMSQGSNSYHQDSVQSSANLQQQGQHSPSSQLPTDISSILKLNDIPYRLTQGISPDAYKLHNPNFDQSGIPTPLPMRLNQNVGSHQIDVANDILTKLLLNKPNGLGRPEMDSQSGGLLSTINGFKVANPFNVDLKLVADVLKGKPSMDESNLGPLREQFNKPLPLKFDMSQLEQLLYKNDNRNLYSLNDNLSLGVINNPYIDLYSGRYPYQGVKYSRSQEEEENIPIADASNTHPIGAVIEQLESSAREVSTDITAQDDDSISTNFEEDRPQHKYSPGHVSLNNMHRHPNSLIPGRHPFSRKYPKNLHEPYPLLKPPPPRSSRNRGNKHDRHRKRRLNKPKVVRMLKTEPLFEAESEENNPEVQTLLRPPPPNAESKSDVNEAEQIS